MSILVDSQIRDLCIPNNLYEIQWLEDTGSYKAGTKSLFNNPEKAFLEHITTPRYKGTAEGGTISYSSIAKIKKLSLEEALAAGFKPMIEPFVRTQVKTQGGALRSPTPEEQAEIDREAAGKFMDFEMRSFRTPLTKIVSYGLSSAGYDVRLGRDFKVFTNVHPGIIDPLNMPEKYFVEMLDQDSCIIPPHSYVLGHTVETFNIPRDVMIICVGKSTYARCFSGDTKVALANGTSVTFLDMVTRAAAGERFFGYGVDEKGKIVVTELIAPRKIGHEKTLRVTLDNGETITCTPDHKFLTRDGRYFEAQDLQSGDSLFPLYRYVTRGYEAVVQQTPLGWEPTHRLADQWNIRQGIYAPAENQHRHHIDHDRRNNYPTNITRVNAGDHIREHNAISHADEAYIHRMAETHRANYARNSQDPVWYEKFVEQCRRAAHRFWHDEDMETARAKHRENQVRRMANLSEEERQANADRLRAYNMLESTKIAKKERLAVLWKDPEFRKKQGAAAAMVNNRADINEDTLRAALREAGTVRGAAKLLKCDRAAFRKLQHVLDEFNSAPPAQRLTEAIVERELTRSQSVTRAAYRLRVAVEDILRFKDAITRFFGSPVAVNHKVVSIEEVEGTQDVYCLTAPETGNFALEAGVFVKNCGAHVNVTPIEPGFKGQVVIEVANSTPLPLKIHAGQGIAQFVFHRADRPCEISYGDRGGKYQNQQGIQEALV